VSGGHLDKQEIINFALQKLRNSVTIPRLKLQQEGVNFISKARRDADLVALAVCVLFDFGELYASQRIQMELIASHMRVVWSMNKRREYVISGYPCEPILAHAALHHMRQVNKLKERYSMLCVMRDAVVERHIAKGERGELVARLILILAYYDASRPLDAVPTPLGPTDDVSTRLEPIPSVSVKEFLCALLPDKPGIGEFWSRSPRRGGSPDATVERVFGHAKVYFTHFVRYTMTPKAKHLWAAVVRGQAIQCSYQQEEVDIIIPIVLDPTARLAEEHMSAILIQVRNRTSVAAHLPDAARIGVLERKTPYISIVFQFGLKDAGGN